VLLGGWAGTVGVVGDIGDFDAEVPLEVWGSGAQSSKARRRAGVVYREAGPWSSAVLALLRHLEHAGFAGAPRVVGSGFAADGREMVTWIPGASPQPYAWSEDVVAGVGTLLRELHAAAATFIPPPGACWKAWFGRELPGSQPVIGHGDTGPWNIIARDGRPTALVDFEFAGPVDAIWDLAQAAWLNAQLHDDDVAERLGLPDLAGRARQLRLILDGYGLPTCQRGDFVDKMITFAVHSARAETVEFGVTPQTIAGVTSTGYPFVWGITWRVRSASWMLTNRTRLQRAIS
jgi:Phosphotransferase enzyme family